MIDRYINLLIDRGIIWQGEEEIYKYKLTCFLEKTFTISIMILISLMFRQTISIVMFIVSFFWLRSRMGGFHLDSFKGCFVGTIGTEIVLILLIKYRVVPLIISEILSAIATVIIFILGASNHPNMNYDKDEYRFNKKYARLIVIVEFSAILFFIGLDVSEIYIQAVEYSIILSAVLLVMAFTMGQHKKDVISTKNSQICNKISKSAISIEK